MPPDAQPVVVGTDGSSGALLAVTWAAGEASLREAPLRIVHASAPRPALNLPPVAWQVGPHGGARAHAELAVSGAEKAAREVAPAVPISTAVVTDFPLALLVNESRRACLLVVGVSGVGALTDVLAGSLTTELVSRALAPVAVIRGGPSPTRTDHLVVVGVDGSPLSAAAVDVAAEEAALRNGRLLAIYVRRERESWWGRRRRATRELQVVRQTILQCRRRYPGLPIERRIVSGHPSGILVDLSSRADMVVAGTRGRGGFAGLLLGSVSQALLQHAECPVLVVSRRAARRRASEGDSDSGGENDSPDSTAHDASGR